MNRAGEVRRGLLGQGSIYSLALLSPVIASLAITPVLTRQLRPDDYGAVAIALSITAFGAILATGGLNLSVTRNALIGSDGTSGAAGQVLVGTAVAIFIGLIAIGSTPFWGAVVLPSNLEKILIPPIISAVVLAINTLVQSLLRAVERVKTFVMLSLSSALLGPGLGVVYLSIYGHSPAQYLWLVALGQSITALIAIVVLFDVAKPNINRESIRKAYSISLPTIPHQISTNLLTLGMVFIAGATHGLEEAGRIQLALLLGTAPITVLGAVNNAWGPLIYRSPVEERSEVVKSAANLVIWLVVTIVSAYLLVLPWFSTLIGGDVLEGTSDLSAIALAIISVAFLAVYLANIHLVIAQGMTKWLAVTTPTSVAVTLLAVYLATASADEFVVSAFTLGLTMFYFIQLIFSNVLRRRSGASAWDQRRLITPTIVIATSCVLWGVVLRTTDFAWIVPVITVICVIWKLVYSRVHRRGK